MLKHTVLSAVARTKVILQDLIVVATLVKRGSATYVPGGTPTYDETSDSIRLAVLGFESQEIDGDRIQASDMQGLVWPEDAFVDVSPNDLLQATVKGKSNTFRVITNKPVMVGDTIALHQLHLRLT